MTLGEFKYSKSALTIDEASWGRNRGELEYESEAPRAMGSSAWGIILQQITKRGLSVPSRKRGLSVDVNTYWDPKVANIYDNLASRVAQFIRGHRVKRGS